MTPKPKSKYQYPGGNIGGPIVFGDSYTRNRDKLFFFAAFEAQRQNVTEADEAFRIASLRFERGLATQLEVSDAQLLLLTVRTNAARATIDYYLAAAELARARGVDIPLPPTRPTTR